MDISQFKHTFTVSIKEPDKEEVVHRPHTITEAMNLYSKSADKAKVSVKVQVFVMGTQVDELNVIESDPENDNSASVYACIMPLILDEIHSLQSIYEHFKKGGLK